MTSDHHDPDAAPELQDEFWGEATEWTPRPLPATEHQGLGATVGRWWSDLLGGRESAGRVHGEPRTRSHHDEGPPLGDADVDEAWAIEPEPQPRRQPGVDPLIARLGGLAVVLTLAAPLVLGITASGSDSEPDGAALATVAGAPTADPDSAPISAETQPAATVAAPVATSGATAEVSSTTPSSDATVADQPPDEPAAEQAVALEASSDTESAGTTATAATTPVTTVRACGSDYELGAGDYWIRIADAAGVSLADLLDVNDASVNTVLVPGRSICLPVGASRPAPPTTAAPPTRAPASASAGSGSSTRTPATTAAPAPTTTVPARPAAVPESAATAIIREIWPDELEERALEIAWRESNHQSNVNNFCCYGLFQIYFSVHRSWLATIGVNSAQDLFDPRANALAAYTLYQRAGGWGPWGG